MDDETKDNGVLILCDCDGNEKMREGGGGLDLRDLTSDEMTQIRQQGCCIANYM